MEITPQGFPHAAAVDSFNFPISDAGFIKGILPSYLRVERADQSQHLVPLHHRFLRELVAGVSLSCAFCTFRVSEQLECALKYQRLSVSH